MFNDRGQMLVGVKLTDGIRRGAIRVSEGGWYDPEHPGTPGTLCRYGDVNNLTIGIGTSKLAQGNFGRTAMADVEKYRGEPPAVLAFVPPHNAVA
ncbi:hypothetical protein CBA19C6_29330 [Cupriavidus pauculus]|nr:hypothetical protein CBA19C6_29330 [Cupriavidus pauculus]